MESVLAGAAGVTQERERGRSASEHRGSLQQLVGARGISQEALSVSRCVRAVRKGASGQPGKQRKKRTQRG